METTTMEITTMETMTAKPLAGWTSLEDYLERGIADMQLDHPNWTGSMSVQDIVMGDIPVGWDKKNKIEVAFARKAFNALRKKGFLAYRNDSKAEIMFKFDPDAAHVVFTMNMKGG